MKKTLWVVALAGALLAPVLAQAHTGFHAEGALVGALHPFTGLDHLLAMVAVGFWASTLAGKSRFFVPLVFVLVMAVGAIFGMAQIGFPHVETAIAASVVVLGLLIAFNVKVSAPAAAALVGLCALFHGHAHGLEMPEMANPLAYGLGFIAATAALHLAGLGLGTLRNRMHGVLLGRIVGGLTAAAGLALLAG